MSARHHLASAILVLACILFSGSPAFTQEAMGASASEGRKQEAMGASASEGKKQEAMGLSADPSAIASATAEASAKAEASATEGKKQEEVRDPSAIARRATAEAEGRKNRDTKSPQIVIDEKTNTVRVLIGGKEVVSIDAKGLHVRGNLDYSGIITDTGRAPP